MTDQKVGWHYIDDITIIVIPPAYLWHFMMMVIRMDFSISEIHRSSRLEPQQAQTPPAKDIGACAVPWGPEIG